MKNAGSLPKSTKETMFFVGTVIYGFLLVGLVILMFTGCAQKRPIVYTQINMPTEPNLSIPDEGDKYSPLADRGLGFYDGCVAAGKKAEKCASLAEKYVSNLKNLTSAEAK
jgi:hypothetical protein